MGRELTARDLRTITALAEEQMRLYLGRVGRAMSNRHGSAWPGGTGAASLSRRSGAGLAGLTNGAVSRGENSVTGTITVPRYLANQEFGIVSTAKQAKYLTIPLPAALNPNGTPKKRSARGWLNTFIVKGKQGSLVICTKRGRRVIALYVLKPSIRIRPRLGMRKVMRSEMKMFKTELGKRVRALTRASS